MENSNVNDLALNCEYVTCKICKEEKKRIRAGKYPSGKDWKLVNEHGQQWNGKACPECHSGRIARRQKAKRNERKLYI